MVETSGDPHARSGLCCDGDAIRHVYLHLAFSFELLFLGRTQVRAGTLAQAPQAAMFQSLRTSVPAVFAKPESRTRVITRPALPVIIDGDCHDGRLRRD